MISSYKLVNNGFWPVSAGNAPEWIDLEDPCSEELSEIAARYNVPPMFLVDPLDHRERPRLDDENGISLVIVRLPIYHNSAKRQFSTMPLGLIMMPGMVITVCREPGIVKQLVSRQIRKPRQVALSSMLYKIFVEISSDFIHQLEVLEEMAEEAEMTLGKSQQNEQILTLLTIEKALINFSVALHSNRSIMEKVRNGDASQLSKEQTDWVDYALNENQQALFTVEIFGQIVGSMSDAFGTIISNNLNKVMKFLTGVTIILMVPTLIVGAYGMNVQLPLAESPWAFAILVVFSVGLSLAIWLYFNRRKWI
ncbi:MAG: magnesium transporter CorA family protein [Deltaproteobacteria bacterium]|jgi:magnesium transporter|nr:magnesium transporter CorA family protein [Deltaproteobacteria bacterium]